MHTPPRWVVAVSLVVAGTLLGDSLLYAVLPTVWPQLGLEVGMVGVLLSANRFVRLVTNPIAGRVFGRVGVRGPFIAAVFTSVAATAAYGLRAGFLMFLVARVLWGVCWSFLRLGGYLAALESSDQQSRGYYLGFFNGAARIGTLTAVLFGGILTDQIGFRSTVFLFAAITLVGGLAILREQPIPQPVGADSRAAHTTPRALRDQPIESPKGLLNGPPNGYASRGRRWVVYGAAFVNGSAGSNLVVATLGLWLLELYGPMIQIANLTLGVASLTGLLLATRFLADVVLAPAAGHLSDRYGRVWFIIAAGTVTVSTLAGLSIRAGLAWTMVMAVCVFLSGTALHAALDAAAGDLAPPSGRSRVMSWYANWSDLGAATGPLVAYQLGVGLGLEWVYRGGAACLTLAGLASLALSRDRRKTKMFHRGKDYDRMR